MMTIPHSINQDIPLSTPQGEIVRTLQQHKETVVVFSVKVDRRGTWLETQGVGDWMPDHALNRSSVRRLVTLGLMREVARERGVAKYALTEKGQQYTTPREFSIGQRVRITRQETWQGEICTITRSSRTDPQMYFLKEHGWRRSDEIAEV